MWVLHTWNVDDCVCLPSRDPSSDRRGDQGCDLRKYMPLHRICAYHPSNSPGARQEWL